MRLLLLAVVVDGDVGERLDDAVRALRVKDGRSPLAVERLLDESERARLVGGCEDGPRAGGGGLVERRAWTARRVLGSGRAVRGVLVGVGDGEDARPIGCRSPLAAVEVGAWKRRKGAGSREPVLGAFSGPVDREPWKGTEVGSPLVLGIGAVRLKRAVDCQSRNAEDLGSFEKRLLADERQKYTSRWRIFCPYI